MGTRQQLVYVDIAASFPHKLLSSQLGHRPTVRDLGVTLDQELSFASHINRLCRDCYTTSCASSASSRSITARLHLSMLLSQHYLTTSPHFTLVSLAYA